jgi:pyruvate ferredoxin oxidoreductase alpha subunit
VLVNVSRGLSAPITLEPDHNDLLSARDSGFLLLHCASCQEVLDTVLMAYRLGEDPRVRLPVLVNLDGFYLSFTREPVELPEAAACRDWLGDYRAENIRFRASAPISQAVAVLGGGPYSYFRYQMQLAMDQALAMHAEVADEFARRFGRRYRALEAHRMDGAEYALVMMGSFASKAEAAVDALRAEGWPIGLLRPRLLRPWPEAELRAALAPLKAAAVIDQNLSLGRGGILHTEIAASLAGTNCAPLLLSYVGGLGGRDIGPEEFFGIARELRAAVERGQAPPPRLLYTATELRELRKLQTLAGVERERLGEAP